MGSVATGNGERSSRKNMHFHHHGAVGVAGVVMQDGTDPAARKRSRAVIAAQEAEIQWMQDWLAANTG